MIAYLHKETEDLAYRIYITDSLQVLTENTARFAGGKQITVRFYDQIHPKKEEQPKQSGKEIADNLIAALSGKSGGK